MRIHAICALFALSYICCFAQVTIPEINQLKYKVYPEVLESKPDLPSPFMYEGQEYVMAVTKDNQFALMEVTLSNDRGICRQLIIDSVDFPELQKKGLHSNKKLRNTQQITGWSVDTISLLGQPGGLSNGGFMADGEDIISVLSVDNQIVNALGLTHPAMAKPLFHVLNMMDHDLSLNRWNMAKHEWENVKCFYYQGNRVNVVAYDTKGGQKSIFNDDLGGAFHIKLWRDLSESELKYLKRQYNQLSENEFTKMIEQLTIINIGELQPQYIMRYGFYEGHTDWRAEPIALVFIFGMLSLEDIDSRLEHQLYEKLTTKYYAKEIPASAQ